MSSLMLQLVAVCVVGQVGEQAKVDRHGDRLPAGAFARLGTNRFRPVDKVAALALSPDGKTLASAGSREIALWDMATGKKVGRFVGDREPFLVAFVKQGATLLTVSEPGILRYRDVSSGKIVYEAALVDDPAEWESQACITPDGRFLAFRDTTNHTVCVWDLTQRKEQQRIKSIHYDWGPLAISEDGKTLAFGRRLIEIWDLSTRKAMHKLKPKEATYLSRFGFGLDGKALVTSGTHRHGTRSWDVKTGDPRGSYGVKPPETGAFAISADGKRLATLNYDDGETVRIWDLGSDKEISRWPAAAHRISAMLFTPDGNTLVTAGSEGIVRRWDVALAKEIKTHEGAGGAPRQLVASPDGRWLAAATDRLMLWDLRAQSVAADFDGASWYRVAAFSPDGKRLAYAHDDGSVRLCATATGKEVRRLDQLDKKVKPDDRSKDVIALAFDPTGQTLFVSHRDVTLRVRKTSDGQVVRQHVLSQRPFFQAPQPGNHFFSRDGSALMTVFDDPKEPYRIWDTRGARYAGATAKLTDLLGGTQALAPDGRTFAIATREDAITIYESSTGLKRIELRPGRMPDVFAFGGPLAWTPDGRLLASRDPIDKSLELWDLASGQRVHKIDAEQGGVSGIAFVGNGDVLATGGSDTTILLWDLSQVRRKLALPAGPRTPEQLGPLWEQLASEQPREVIWNLVGGGDTTIAFLRKKVHPFEGATDKEIAEQIRRLDDVNFVVRDKAVRQLEQWGELSVSALVDGLTKNPTLEARRRMEQLLQKIAPVPPAAPSAYRLRELRALEVAEIIGSPAAIDFVRDLTRGASGAWLTREADATLGRMLLAP